MAGAPLRPATASSPVYNNAISGVGLFRGAPRIIKGPGQTSVLDDLRAEEYRRINDARSAPVAGVTQAPTGMLTGPEGFSGGGQGLFQAQPFHSSGLTSPNGGEGGHSGRINAHASVGATADDYYKARDPGAITNLSDLQNDQASRSSALANLLTSQEALRFPGGMAGGSSDQNQGGFHPFGFGATSTGGNQSTDAQSSYLNAINQAVRDPYAGTHSWDDGVSQASVFRNAPPVVDPVQAKLAEHSAILDKSALDDVMRGRGEANRLHPPHGSVLMDPATGQYKPDWRIDPSIDPETGLKKVVPSLKKRVTPPKFVAPKKSASFNTV